jgi:threonylcarbamoyladenosine tRNA methylthiotransferase MtaB
VRVYLRTYGCRANQYDSEQIRVLVEGAGGEIVTSPELADAAVFNSCAVTAGAEAELRKDVRRAARAHPALRTIITGCAAALSATDLRALPGVQGVIGGVDLPRLAATLELPANAATGRTAAQSGARALLRIQDGCDEHCTFCATTLARGANRSRPGAEIVDEAQRLADHHPEIVLTGIHIGAYGADIHSSLGALVERLLSDVSRVRFRLSSIEATEVDARLAEMLADSDGRLAPHLHAPLQSGSDRVLRRMGRYWYTSTRYAAAIERVAGAREVFALGADVIAGFPGESEADHEATLALIDRLPFTYLHVFPYSPRAGTAAERLRTSVDPTVAAQRARELRDLGTRKAAAYQSRRNGGKADVVVIRSEGRREGLTEDYLTVSLADASLPRGTRLPTRLALEEGRLVATVSSQEP